MLGSVPLRTSYKDPERRDGKTGGKRERRTVRGRAMREAESDEQCGQRRHVGDCDRALENTRRAAAKRAVVAIKTPTVTAWTSDKSATKLSEARTGEERASSWSVPDKAESRDYRGRWRCHGARWI